ncbi:MAG: adenylosuccinate lyase [Bacteroidales bacterium]|jgi:adenylosuccinate lyase|nr:adenylosuccinate lyase [Bacteroidales bacterium]
MDFSLHAISPVDGRYHKLTEPLAAYFSESAIIRYRILIEVEYFIALCKLPLPQLKSIDKKVFSKLRSIYEKFDPEQASRVKEIEKETNHDVKAIEYFLKEQFDRLGFGEYREFIHFALTSQDINNSAFPLALRDAWRDIVEPLLENIYRALYAKSKAWKNIPMLAHTHGQPASPTTVGKELYVFAERLGMQLALMETIPVSAKFGGAIGNFNAHHVAFPDIDWVKFANRFINNTLGLERCQTTTQIEHYDNLAAFFDNLRRINNILIDLDRDLWAYISMDYFKQKVKSTETGSSTMPHKVNPIDFENSEGNLGLANAICEHLSAKLPISRLQRDLTDSTVLRNIGIPIAHSVIAYKSLLKGLDKLLLNEEVIHDDLDRNWVIVSEAIQTILRRENYPAPYEVLKKLTRGKEKFSRKDLGEFIDNLDVPQNIKEELNRITPENYIGIIDF